MKQGWEIKSISDVCEVIAGQSPKGKYYNDKGDGLPFYQGKKLFGEKYLEEPNTWTSVTTKESYVGDIVMSVRAPVGDVNFNYHKKICIGRGLAGIRAGKTVNKDYLFYFLIHHKNKIVGNTGAVFNSINKSQIEAIPIPIPAFDEQKRIVAKLDKCFEAIDKARVNVEKNLNNAKELFQSQLNQIFSQKGDGWVEMTLGEMCEVITKGTTPTSVGFRFINEGINFIKIESITLNGKFIPTKFAHISNECHNALNRSQLKDGDILFSIAGALGRTAIVTNEILPANTNQALSIIRLKNDVNLLKTYLLYSLSEGYVMEQIEKYRGGVAQQNLSLTQMKSFQVPIPPIDTQKKIVIKLDELKSKTQSLESNYQQELDALDELKKSILQKAFNGEL